MSPPGSPAEATAGAAHGLRPAWLAMAAPLLVLAFLVGHEWPGNPLHPVPFVFAGLLPPQ